MIINFIRLSLECLGLSAHMIASSISNKLCFFYSDSFIFFPSFLIHWSGCHLHNGPYRSTRSKQPRLPVLQGSTHCATKQRGC